MSAPHASPPPAEPKTPMWLTALGALLFALVGVYWIATPSSDSNPPEAAAAAADSGAPGK